MIVAGLGGMGSAALMHLADRGRRVLGLERFSVPNTLGSSHGETRIIRLAYFEHSSYVPLLRRAFELWRELEARSGQHLLKVTAGLDAGREDSRVFAGSLRSCLEHGLPHEVLTGEEVNRRFPAYRLPVSHRAVLQPDAGYLIPEACIDAHARLAVAGGAKLQSMEGIEGWEAGGDGVIVHTRHREYTAERLLLCAGPWTGKLEPALTDVVVPERQVIAWFRPRHPDLFTPGVFPIFVNEVPEGTFYGFPIHSIPGFKLGRFHHLEERSDPDAIDRDIHPADEWVLREHVRAYFPDANGDLVHSATCMFSNTPDEHFIIDFHPNVEGVVIAAGFSGHGFKFCSVVGEILADLAIDGSTRHETALFKIDRFKPAAAAG